MTVSPMPQKLRPALWHHTDSLRWQICRSHCGDRFDRPQCDGVGDFRGAGFLAATTLVGFGRECVDDDLVSVNGAVADVAPHAGLLAPADRSG